MEAKYCLLYKGQGTFLIYYGHIDIRGFIIMYVGVWIWYWGVLIHNLHGYVVRGRGPQAHTREMLDNLVFKDTYDLCQGGVNWIVFGVRVVLELVWLVSEFYVWKQLEWLCRNYEVDLCLGVCWNICFLCHFIFQCEGF